MKFNYNKSHPQRLNKKKNLKRKIYHKIFKFKKLQNANINSVKLYNVFKIKEIKGLTYKLKPYQFNAYKTRGINKIIKWAKKKRN
jgi:hypothetical protein